jgi:ribosomal protein S18 acetylase RimI-like enzyme
MSMEPTSDPRKTPTGTARATRASLRLVAARTLRELQSLRAYRRVAARLTPRFTFSEPTPAEVETAERRLAPGGVPPDPHDDPSVTRWVARRGTRMVGFVELVQTPAGDGARDRFWLCSLEVWPAFRGLGIGRALVERVSRDAQHRGAIDLRVTVFTDDRRAIAFYEALGFSMAVDDGLSPLLEGEHASGSRRRVVLRRALALEDATSRAPGGR